MSKDFSSGFPDSAESSGFLSRPSSTTYSTLLSAICLASLGHCNSHSSFLNQGHYLHFQRGQSNLKVAHEGLGIWLSFTSACLANVRSRVQSLPPPPKKRAKWHMNQCQSQDQNPEFLMSPSRRVPARGKEPGSKRPRWQVLSAAPDVGRLFIPQGPCPDCAEGW